MIFCQTSQQSLLPYCVFFPYALLLRTPKMPQLPPNCPSFCDICCKRRMETFFTTGSSQFMNSSLWVAITRFFPWKCSSIIYRKFKELFSCFIVPKSADFVGMQCLDIPNIWIYQYFDTKPYKPYGDVIYACPLSPIDLRGLIAWTLLYIPGKRREKRDPINCGRRRVVLQKTTQSCKRRLGGSFRLGKAIFNRTCSKMWDWFHIVSYINCCCVVQGALILFHFYLCFQ